MDFIDYVPPPQETVEFAGTIYSPSTAGVLTLSLENVNIQIQHDGGESGCGGKVWPAGELLSKYVIASRDRPGYLFHDVWMRARQHTVSVVELGSGTGLVGLALSNAAGDERFDIKITDQKNMLPLMAANIALNGKHDVQALELDWGAPLSIAPPDVVLAADCVYLEQAFPLLERTLLDLTGRDTLVLMSYKKRRRADSRFFSSAKKKFKITEIKDYEGYDEFRKQSVYLYRFELP